jgi:sulfoacetaldehyde acetyltransferase
MKEAIALAELLHAPVACSYLHNDAFPASHPLWCGPLGYQGSKAAMTLISKADVVIALGTRLGPFGTLPQYGMEYWPKNAKIIQIDADPHMLGLVRPISVGICGDAREAAGALVARLVTTADGGAAEQGRARQDDQGREGGVGEGARRLDPRDRRLLGGDLEGQRRHAPAADAARARKARCRRHAMVSTDIGNICSVSNSYLRFDEPRSMLAPMSFGNCGYAFPVACGAKVARPDRPAFAYVGDGAVGHLAERAAHLRAREDRRDGRCSSTTASGARRRRTTWTSTRAATRAWSWTTPSWAAGGEVVRLRGRRGRTRSATWARRSRIR